MVHCMWLTTVMVTFIDVFVGMPVGPITLSDEVGIDVSYNVGKFMAGADLGDRMLGTILI